MALTLCSHTLQPAIGSNQSVIKCGLAFTCLGGGQRSHEIFAPSDVPIKAIIYQVRDTLRLFSERTGATLVVPTVFSI